MELITEWTTPLRYKPYHQWSKSYRGYAFFNHSKIRLEAGISYSTENRPLK